MKFWKLRITTVVVIDSLFFSFLHLHHHHLIALVPYTLTKRFLHPLSFVVITSEFFFFFFLFWSEKEKATCTKPKTKKKGYVYKVKKNPCKLEKKCLGAGALITIQLQLHSVNMGSFLPGLFFVFYFCIILSFVFFLPVFCIVFFDLTQECQCSFIVISRCHRYIRLIKIF